MTELEKAARMALEQLEFLNACYPHKTAADAITALTQALATTERKESAGKAHITDEQKVVEICERIGFGRVQQIAGDAWEQRHNCAPRGRMGVTVRNEKPAAQPVGEPVAYFVTWPGDPVGMRRFYGADEWGTARKTVEYFGGDARPLIFGDTSPQVPEDSERLDWIENQWLDDFAVGFVVDAGHDGEYWCSPESGGMYYGKTLREAIDAARKGE